MHSLPSSGPAPPLAQRMPALAGSEELGRALARLLKPGDGITRSGKLGAGKTALARALIRALPGPQGAADEEVPSPTFTLAQIYERRPGPVWHFDLYRLESAPEVEELGFSEALAGIALGEWPDPHDPLLPAHARQVTRTFRHQGV